MSGFTQRGVPPQPRFLFFIKIAILVLSLLILALAAYSLSIFNGVVGYYGSGSGGFLIFVAIKTFIVFGGVLAIEIWYPQLFYRLAILIAYAFSLIFWLSAWAYAASSASAWLALGDWDGFVGDNYWKAEGGALAACAAFGAIVWILSIFHYYCFIRACLADPQGTGAPSQAELGQVKYQQAGQPGQPQQYPPQQAPYGNGPPAQYGQPQQTYPSA